MRAATDRGFRPSAPQSYTVHHEPAAIATGSRNRPAPRNDTDAAPQARPPPPALPMAIAASVESVVDVVTPVASRPNLAPYVFAKRSNLNPLLGLAENKIEF